ncbi:MAG TPA: tetraacyldisaccharide 4'-kinase [Steroidobacteraceae bacterium]|jgi:tetraacyldisaccharide 4'-kinase
MQRRLVDLWYRAPANASLLQPLAWLYGGLMGLRRWAYAHGWLAVLQAGRPVVVVGNLTVGGTGKTPLVAWLAQRLTSSGLKVGIVSRGYGRRDGGSVRTVHSDSGWREVGDEPLLLHRLTGCATVVARDRVKGARALVARGVDVVLADDGLQHLRLARDCEIVVIDGARGLGNGRLLPAGPLREPARCLREDSLLVCNGEAEHPSLRRAQSLPPGKCFQMSLAGEQAHRLDGQAMPQLLESFRGRRVHAVAGIGNPERFFRGLRQRGIDVVEHPFDDHHAFVASDLAFGDGAPVLMTEKDAVKCHAMADARLWYVPVVARFAEAEARELLDRLIRSLGPLPNPITDSGS